MRWMLVMGLLVGCADEPAPFAPLVGEPRGGGRVILPGLVDEADPLPDSAEGIWATATVLDGDVGEVSVTNTEGWVVNAYLIDGAAYFDTRAEGPRGTMMHAFQLNDFESLEPGTYSTSSSEGIANSIGCSGATDGAWSYDTPGQQVDIEVEDVQGDTQVIRVTTRFETYDVQTITTEVTITRVEPADA